MARNVQAPTLKSKDNHGAVYEHPAFATISAHRITGHTNLFNSHVGHEGFVQIEVRGAELNTDGYGERVSGLGRLYTTVRMSEAQWVAFVSRMNMGSGTPCTLRYMSDGQLVDVPDLPDQPKAGEKLDEQAHAIHDQNIEHVTDGLRKMRELVEGLSKTKANAIMAEAEKMAQHLKANHDFALSQMTKHKEKLVTEAKVEINAMVEGTLTQLGVKSLRELAQLGAETARPALDHDKGEG